ncbi:hypothetical protein BVER_03980c [Candidatus Burkholderia verschuerenii]|uniref:Fis family transcriptional regulator n=1 Tax=Candidatus Burkholderia verschuerenii TaxID=242163 RepID=A0A0L0LZ53_9BURK|nr:hypothetical protein [Candidatus Burkholderia verschuerenii]KND55358.1 hypothetical protein BVER_03980c [Candidatus Burkholderia verschuerenii]
MPNAKRRPSDRPPRNRTEKAYWLPLPRRDADLIILQYRLAVETIRRQRATQVEVQCVAHAVLLTAMLTELGYGRLDASLLEGAEDDVLTMLERGHASGDYSYREEGVQRLIEVINEHDRQLREVHVAALVGCNERLQACMESMAAAG